MTENLSKHRIYAFWVVLFAAIATAIYCLVTPPPGEISESALVLIAQLLVAAGTFIGVDLWILRGKEGIVNEIRELMKEKEKKGGDEE